ncbi:MAG: phosphopyruvate hydratase [Nanoarchaeales archaeon]|nr:phosphopyruvate hydratase [Nanoarchaeales archaeon]
MKILDITALQILDSRGNPTLQVEILLEDGSKGNFQVPSGASTGIHEAHELRDGNKNLFGGKSVYNCVENINNIKDRLIGLNFTQQTLDENLIELDGSENKSILGANTILGISVAFAKASAKFYNLELHEYLYRLINDISFLNKSNNELVAPQLFANIINGGLHSGNKLNIQEFMILPNLGDLELNIKATCEIYQTLKLLIETNYDKSQTAVGDEGGFAPNLSKATQALDLIVEAIKKANYEGQIFLALDAAASDFYNKETKLYEIEEGLNLDYKDLTKYYSDLCDSYPLISIEDAMDEDDFEGFAYFLKYGPKLKFKNHLTNKKNLLSVGDDLLVTNTKRIKQAIELKTCNSLLLKINQIGSLTESIDAYKLAKSKNWEVIVSHRSGETTDDFIADLAVAMESSIKLGAPARGERIAKYNRLLNIFN